MTTNKKNQKPAPTYPLTCGHSAPMPRESAQNVFYAKTMGYVLNLQDYMVACPQGCGLKSFR